MLNEIKRTDLFTDYYAQWVKVYKEGAIRDVTLAKYHMSHNWLTKLVPELKVCNLTRIAYQQLINDYAASHERQTTMDFHHQLDIRSTCFQNTQLDNLASTQHCFTANFRLPPVFTY